MSGDLQELMASNDPMATPIMSVGPPPAMPTHPGNDSIQQQPIAPLMQSQIPMVNSEKPKKKSPLSTPEAKDAFLVALLVFLVLMPGVQAALLNQIPMLEDKTMMGLASALLAGVGYFFAKQHLEQL